MAGSCCDPTGLIDCYDVYREDWCREGFIYREGFLCALLEDCATGDAAYGACCLPNPDVNAPNRFVCYDGISRSLCEDQLGGTWQGGFRCKCVGTNWDSPECRSWDCETGSVKGSCCCKSVNSFCDEVSASNREGCEDDVAYWQCPSATHYFADGTRCSSVQCSGTPHVDVGACCEYGGGIDRCRDGYSRSACEGFSNFYKYHDGRTCSEIVGTLGACRPLDGACCYGAVCAVTDPAACEAGGGVFLGANTECDPYPCEGVRPIKDCRQARTAAERRPPRTTDGGYARAWTPDQCAPGVYGITTYDQAVLSYCRGECDDPKHQGDQYPMTIHPVRAMHIDETTLNINNREVCERHFGRFRILPNGDHVVVFCSKPHDSQFSDSKQTGLAKLYTVTADIFIDGEPDVPMIHKGDQVYIGSHHTPYFAEAHLASDTRICGGVL